MDRRHKFCGSRIPGQPVCPRNGREKARTLPGGRTGRRQAHSLAGRRGRRQEHSLAGRRGRRQEHSLAGRRGRGQHCLQPRVTSARAATAASSALKLPRAEGREMDCSGGMRRGSLLSWTRQNLVELAGSIHNYDGSG